MGELNSLLGNFGDGSGETIPSCWNPRPRGLEILRGDEG